MSRETTTNELASQVTALHQEVRELRVIIERLVAQLTEGGHVAQQSQAVTEGGRVVFLPGTGPLGSGAPPPEGDDVEPDRGAALARAAREALRSENRERQP